MARSAKARPSAGTVAAAPPPRRPCDTRDSYRALCKYAEQPEGARSLRRLAKTLNHSHIRTIEDWSSRHDWQERVAEHDDAIRAKRWERLEAAREARHLEQLEVEAKIQRDARQALDEHAVSTLVAIIKDPDLTAFAKIQAIQTLAKLAGLQNEPRDVKPQAEVSIGAVVKALERAGVRPETLEQLQDDIDEASVEGGA